MYDRISLNKEQDGSIGKQFKADGAIGSVGEAVGGPLASDGAIGKMCIPSSIPLDDLRATDHLELQNT